MKIENKQQALEFQDSMLQATDKLVSATKALMRTAKTEEDLRVGFEKILDPLCRKLNIKLSPKYEKSIYTGGRSDAIHGRVIIEYEKPRAYSADEILNCTKKWAEDNALQIADLFAFTICAFYAFTHSEMIGKNVLGKGSKIPKESFDELLKRIKPECEGKRYFPLPVERLKECHVKEPEFCNRVLSPRQKA